jgi:DNA-binding beta-propeller fold protein YncE
MVAQPDGSQVHVANTCDSDLDAQPGSMSVIDTATNAAVATFPAPYGPVALALDAARQRLYAACLVKIPFFDEDSSGSLYVAHLETGAPLDLLPLFLVPRDLVFTWDGRRVFVTSAGDSPNPLPDVVTVIDATTNALTAAFDGGWAPVGMARVPGSSLLLVPNFYGGTLRVIRARTGELVRTIPVGFGADAVAVVRNRS